MLKTKSSLPPKYVRPNLDRVWAADPFDSRFVNKTAGRELTPLGVCVNSYWWFKQNVDEIGPAFTPIAASLREVMQRECPDTLQEMDDEKI